MIAVFSTLALAEPPVRCDADALEKGREALVTIEPRHLQELAAAALAEACRWPAPVHERLVELRNGWPGGQADLALAVAAPAVFEKTCPGGLRALAEVASLAPAEHRPHLYAACKPGFATAAEWTGGLLVAPVLFEGWLRDLGVAPATVRVYARSLAGISDRVQDNPVRTFVPLFADPRED